VKVGNLLLACIVALSLCDSGSGFRGVQLKGIVASVQEMCRREDQFDFV
jgi:hypothetical protein